VRHTRIASAVSAPQNLAFHIKCYVYLMHAAAMKPGVSWPDMHRLMWRVLLTASAFAIRTRLIFCKTQYLQVQLDHPARYFGDYACQGLKAGGILVGEVEAMMNAGLGAVLAHFLLRAVVLSSLSLGVCTVWSRPSHRNGHPRCRRLPTWLPPSHSRQCSRHF
jgi:hypothetical protein